jgi:uncharacterized membrane protein YecN with MAPEG domain
MPISIPVTLLYGGLNALLVIALGLNVSRLRIAAGTLAGHPQHKELAIPVRAHGNAAEWVPLGIALLLVLEISRAGGSFALHLKVAGATLNYLVLAAMSVCAVALRFTR